MPHELKESSGAIDLSVSAPDRPELFRAALEGVLEAVYGPTPHDGTSEGRIVPIQAAGDGDGALLAGLVDDALRAVREERGTLGSPRWLAFDDKRVTATLPVLARETAGRALELSSASVEPGNAGWTARVELRTQTEG